VEALASPEHQADMEHDDWISSIAAKDYGYYPHQQKFLLNQAQ